MSAVHAILVAILLASDPAAVAPLAPPAVRVQPPPSPSGPPPPSRGATAAREIKGSVQGLIREDDYPSEAIRKNEEGTVGVEITVDERGGVADCVVYQSSGSAALDTQTCRLMWLRARFVPARTPGESGSGVRSRRESHGDLKGALR